MSDFKTIESEGFSFEIFPSARVPLVYKKKFNKGMLEDAQDLVMNIEKSVFLIHQCYLAKCRLSDSEPDIDEDKILDFVSAKVISKAVIEIIKAFTDEINEVTGQKKIEPDTNRIPGKDIAEVLEGKQTPKK